MLPSRHSRFATGAGGGRSRSGSRSGARSCCADALGTLSFFRAPGERLGMHPLIRPFPPRALRGVEPQRILVGHGEAVTEGAAEALRDTSRTHAVVSRARSGPASVQ